MPHRPGISAAAGAGQCTGSSLGTGATVLAGEGFSDEASAFVVRGPNAERPTP